MSTYLQLLFPELIQEKVVPLPPKPSGCKKRKAQRLDFPSSQPAGKYQLIQQGRVIKRFDSFYEACQYGLHRFRSLDFLVLY